MKKIIFSTMIASLLAFVGCQNEELVNDNNTDNSGKKVILTANIQGTADSRVALTPDTDENENPIVKVDWRTFDSTNPETFAVYDLYESNSPTTFTQLSGNVFEGTLPESTNGYCAYYNYALWTRILETHEFLQDGTLREQDVLMYAEFDEDATSIEFDHMTAILKPTFTLGGQSINSTITNIELDGLTFTEMGDVVITVTRTSQEMPLAEDIYVTIPFHLYWDFSSFKPGYTFTFSVKAGDKDYTGSLTIPQIDDWNPYGKLYTATIELTEAYCYLPNGEIFNAAIEGVLGTAIAIEFEANAVGEYTFDEDSGMPSNATYTNDGTTLKIQTNTEQFVFDANCYCMFSSLGTGHYSDITSIKFNNCVNTKNVTNMSDMFSWLTALQELDLSCFNTAKVTTMDRMFTNCNVLKKLNLRSFNIERVETFESMFWGTGNGLQGKNNLTQIYVATPNPFDGKNTSIDSYNTKAVYNTSTPE